MNVYMKRNIKQYIDLKLRNPTETVNLIVHHWELKLKWHWTCMKTELEQMY